MIIPFVILDGFLTLFQAICFTLYRTKKVDRSRDVIIDRHKLKHLNSLERFNYVYCGYGIGVLNNFKKISARTEQYWRPIKHVRKVIGRHARYHDFIEFGDAADYHERLAEFRKKMESWIEMTCSNYQ